MLGIGVHKDQQHQQHQQQQQQHKPGRRANNENITGPMTTAAGDAVGKQRAARRRDSLFSDELTRLVLVLVVVVVVVVVTYICGLFI